MARVSGTWRDPNRRYNDPEQNPLHTCFGCEECAPDIDMMDANENDED